MASTAVRIVLVAESFHLGHVSFGNGFVAGFVKNDARVIAVVDDRVAHQLNALLPPAAIDILFRIARRHRFHQADAVA